MTWFPLARYSSKAASILPALLLSIAPAVAQTTEAPASPETQEQSDATQPSGPSESVTVGLYMSPPFVMEEDGKFTGMAFELWEDHAAALNLESNYVVASSLRDLVDSTAAGAFDVAVTNLTITQARAERLDFSQPWFDAGLQIMTNEGRSAGFRGIIAGLQKSGYLRTYGLIALAICLTTLLITLFYRRFDPDFPREWPDSLAEGFYSVMSLTTTGKAGRKNLLGWVGRIWQALWLVCGVAVFAYVTSTVTSVMTTLALTDQINSLEDLPGRTVAVRGGSIAEEFVQNSGLQFRAYSNIDEAAEALQTDRVDAMIGDGPVLEYYVFTHPDLTLQVVGEVFEPDKYGFAVPLNSKLTKNLNIEVIGKHEEGRVEELHEKYFGEDSLF